MTDWTAPQTKTGPVALHIGVIGPVQPNYLNELSQAAAEAERAVDNFKRLVQMRPHLLPHLVMLRDGKVYAFSAIMRKLTRHMEVLLGHVRRDER